MRQSSGFVICLAVSKYVNPIIEEEEHASLSRNILKILPGLREIWPAFNFNSQWIRRNLSMCQKYVKWKQEL